MKIEAAKSTNDPMVEAFARAIEGAGGKSLLVGGIVRDELLGLPSKDVDFEVFGLPMEKIQEIMTQFGNVKEVGQQFGVLNITELDWDVALPRREMKTGEGHKGFDVVPDPTMTIEEAARRRDLTINAISKDPLTGEIIDPLNGMADLKAGILRMADPKTFGQDPLRALRVAQFAARLDFEVDPQTLELVAAQPLEELPGERILPEFSKMLLKGKTPSRGIEVLRQANLLRYFPEIEALQGVPQEPKWHPEGDVFIHTMMVIDEAGKQRTGDPAFDLPLMFGALAHDFGKPAATEEIDGKITSRGHEESGVEPTRAFMGRMKAPLTLTKQVETLVAFHLRPAILPNTGGGRKGYRKLGRELEEGGVSPDLLTAMSKADVLGRTTEAALRRDVSSQDKFLEEYHQHVTSQATGPGGKLVDSVSGKHLIEKGFKPGPDMGKFLALTRSIEDDTGITDPNKLIELATRFLSDRSKEGGTKRKSELDCGDSHVRPGEECYDGDYREMRKQGKTKSGIQGAQGPDAFRTHPDPSEPDRLLWHEFEWPSKDDETVHHPGLATAEPARQHKRSLKYQPRWFDSGTRFSERPLEGPGSRDGFSGSLPFTPPEQEHTGPPPIPQDEINWESVNPEPETPMEAGQDAYFPTQPPFADKNRGFPDWDITPKRDPKRSQPHPSPMRAEESPNSSVPGKFQRFPGGGGLDRAPMVRPQGKSKPTGFLPVVTMPDPNRNAFKAGLDSDVDQHELQLGLENGDDIDVARRNLELNPQHYTDKPRHELDSIPNKEKNQVSVPETEAVEGAPRYGRGGQDPNPEIPLVRNRSGKGGHNGGDKSREDFDYDYTGKKPGFLSMDLPKEQRVTKSARTREDLEDIGTIFPKDYNLPINDDGPTIGPSTKHRNKRDVPQNPIQGDEEDVRQKQAQPLIPNQKLAIAIDPNGQPGERIVILQPMFEEVSPAIQALRSQVFEKHGAVVVDGPPLWLLTMEPKLEALDKNASLENSTQLYHRVLQLAQQAGLTVDYTQEPKA